jgi:hypothetical protein
MAVVYQHIRKDTQQVFYIGIGRNEKRAYYFYHRSKFWNNIYSKTEIEVQIVCNDIKLELAYDIEKYLISYYGRKDIGLGNLVNLTSGGETILGIKYSEESKLKMSKSKLGKKREDLSGDKNHMYGKTHSDEYKLKMSETLKKVKNTDDNKKKVSEQFKGCKQSAEHIAKRLASMPKSYKKKECPYCNVIGAGGNMSRYHFNKCKKYVD